MASRARDPSHAKPAVPVYRDVYLRLRSQILSGHLTAGERLPSSRTLAQQLGVARGTVEVAYQMLAGEGYTIGDGARGTIVNPQFPRLKKPVRLGPAAVRPEETTARSLLPPTPLMFQMGLPALDAFPRKLWAHTAVRIARQLDVEQLAHPHDVFGYTPLRQAIASYLRIARDVSCSADQIMITAGFQGALGVIVQALLQPGDRVWVEDPGYFFARELLVHAGARPFAAPVDDEGLNVASAAALAPRATLALVTPTHQFPFGTTLPAYRRLELLDWAQRQHAFIVEDDYDCEFHHRGAPPPALKSMDRYERVLYVGSFSKVLFPGLRLGYLVVPDTLTERFTRFAHAAQPAPSLMMQKIVEAFMSGGHFARHLSRMRGLYTERRRALATALAAAMPRRLEINLADGGMHFVAWLRGKTADADIVARLMRHGMRPSPLSRCWVKGPGLNGLLIGYTNVAKEDAGAAARRMQAAMR